MKSSGWHTVKYDNVDGKYLYDRCHLIGYQLTADNANERRLLLMKCPYCGEEMKSGKIVMLKDLSIKWLPEGEKMPKILFPNTIEKKAEEA